MNSIFNPSEYDAPRDAFEQHVGNGVPFIEFTRKSSDTISLFPGTECTEN